MMFSRTVSPGKIRRPSGTWEIPRRTIASGFSPRMLLPRYRISPLTFGTSPDSVRKVVDLPAPLEPSRVTISPSSTLMSSPFSTGPAP